LKDLLTIEDTVETPVQYDLLLGSNSLFTDSKSYRMLYLLLGLRMWYWTNSEVQGQKRQMLLYRWMS